MDATTATAAIPIVLTAEEIEALPLLPLDASIEGVTHRVVWRTDTSIAGVMTLEGGSRLGSHSHRLNHHHLWVIRGQAEILGVMVGPGSYVHVPAGTAHDVDARATAGCTVLYLYES